MTLTKAMKEALLWLRNRGGEGVFAGRPGNRMLLARGDQARVMHTTWERLHTAGLVSKTNLRVIVTADGHSVDLTGILEADTYERALP